MQNWNNLIDYIKIELGAKLNFLEMSDDEIVKALKEHVLPYFSQYCPHTKSIKVSHSDRINSDRLRNKWMYKLNCGEDYIMEIIDAYPKDANYSISNDDPYYGTKYSKTNARSSTATYDYFGAIDFVINNAYMDAFDSLSTRNTWQFFPPNIISFDCEIEGAIVIYSTPHKKLETISPDMYNICFKMLCLGKVQGWIAQLRSKYAEISTPFSTIRMNWEKLEQDSKENLTAAKDILEKLPPHHLITISV